MDITALVSLALIPSSYQLTPVGQDSLSWVFLLPGFFFFITCRTILTFPLGINDFVLCLTQECPDLLWFFILIYCKQTNTALIKIAFWCEFAERLFLSRYLYIVQINYECKSIMHAYVKQRKPFQFIFISHCEMGGSVPLLYLTFHLCFLSSLS